MGWLLLYYCAVPRLNHALRTTLPKMAFQFVESHDAAILETFMAIFQIPTRRAWDDTFHNTTFANWVTQATLPLRLSGMGLRSACRTSGAAYWASWADALP